MITIVALGTHSLSLATYLIMKKLGQVSTQLEFSLSNSGIQAEQFDLQISQEFVDVLRIKPYLQLDAHSGFNS